VSTDKQEEPSPHSQEKLLQAYAAQNNIIIKDFFLSWAFPGKKKT
jgi:hypothetical protein